MKGHLERTIIEQINRALTLKNKIPHPTKYSELSGLSDKCEYILDEQIVLLNALRDELANREESDIDDLIRSTRSAIRQISSIEYYGISTLYYQTEDLGFLNKLAFKIHEEINLPFGHPCISCTGTQYYSSVPDVNVIFVPLGESDFLLHLPDIYHEIGHCVAKNLETVQRLKPLLQAYQQAVSRIASTYRSLLRQKRREYIPPEMPVQIERIYTQWKYWIEEVFCDLFALYTLGPTYAWSHIHLSMKTSEDIYKLDMFFGTTHPAAAARMSLLLSGLKLLGWVEDITNLQERWNEVASYWSPPIPEYQYAYPQELLSEIAKIIHDGLLKSDFDLAHRADTNSDASKVIRTLLNSAWRKFWEESPDGFRSWEESAMLSLRSELGQRA